MLSKSQGLSFTWCIGTVRVQNTCRHEHRTPSVQTHVHADRRQPSGAGGSGVPLGAVLVAQLAPTLLVRVLPDQLVSVSRNTVGAAEHTVGAVFIVGTLGTLVWTLQEALKETLIRQHQKVAFFLLEVFCSTETLNSTKVVIL